MGKEIYNIINDMAEVLNASQMQKLQEVLINRLSENNTVDYLQTDNEEFLDMFLTAKHLEGCSDKTIRYYRCNIEKMLDEQIDTTLRYAMVNQNNVKLSHRKYIS